MLMPLAWNGEETCFRPLKQDSNAKGVGLEAADEHSMCVTHKKG